MARTTRKKKTEDVQELPLDAEPAPETTPEFKAEKPKFPENPGNDKQDTEAWALRHILYENDKQDTEAWAKAALVDPQPILPFEALKPPTPEEVTKEILATHGDINEMGNTQMLRHILYELVWARLWKTPKSK